MTYKKIVHRFWPDPDDMPQNYIEFGEKWESLNPGWVVMDHGEEVLQLWPDLADVFNHLYSIDAGRDGAELHSQVSEIVGYALIREFGGIYVRSDMEPIVANLETELPNMAWAVYESEVDWKIDNSAIGAPRSGDPFWVDLLATLPESYFRGELKQHLTDCALHGGRLYVFPRWAFNCTTTSEDFMSPMALAIRHA